MKNVEVDFSLSLFFFFFFEEVAEFNVWSAVDGEVSRMSRVTAWLLGLFGDRRPSRVMAACSEQILAPDVCPTRGCSSVDGGWTSRRLCVDRADDGLRNSYDVALW